MSVLIGTLCINEMEWLPRLYEQHRDWPGLKKWVFVESADRTYAQTNPELVSADGLSIDGTSEFLQRLATEDDRVVYTPHGFGDHEDVAQGKCPARQRYMDVATIERPDYILALDADEFYMRDDQPILDKFMQSNTMDGVLLKYYNIWRPSCIADKPLMELEMVGSFWQIIVCKLWKWYPGLCYNGNHNAPYHDGVYSNRRLNWRMYRHRSGPRFIHMGFASKSLYRNAKNQYYADRGEARKTPKYVASRNLFRIWKPGMELSNKEEIIKYTGPIPEAFLNEV